MSSDSTRNDILLNTGLLCLKLTDDYIKENSRILKNQIRDGVNVRDNKLKLKELENCFEIGLFVIEESKKYYKVMQITDEYDLKIHCFVEMETGLVYKPQSKNYPSKKASLDLKDCIRFADWRGYYLKSMTES